MPPALDRKKIVKLMKFVAEQAKKANGPMNVKGLCRQFIEETGSSVSLRSLEQRIHKYRAQIRDMDEFDMETKARMLMAVGARVDSDFLRELRKEADVEVDEQHRIIRYEKKTQSNDVTNQRGGSDEASTPSKRRRDSERDTSGERKRIRGGDEDSMTIGGHHIPQNIGEEFDGPDEVDQKPVNLIQNRHRFYDQPGIEYHHEENVQHAPLDPENLMEEVPENRVPEEESTSVRNLLVLLRGTLMPLESPHLNGLQNKIEAKIQKLSREGDVQIPLDNIHLTFDACLFQLVKHSFSKTEEESTSQRNFLCSLRSATCHLAHPSMAPFHEKLATQIAKSSVHDQNILIKIVQNAIDAIINFIDP